MDSMRETYRWLFTDLADGRVANWPLMADPMMVIIITLLYVKAVFSWLPKYMENRRAYDLRTVLRYYNLFQIIYCSWMVYGVATSGWTTHYNWGCQVIDYSTDPMAMRMLKFMYGIFLVKIVDLMETFFFVLRKKENQISRLHLYHHMSTLLSGWIGVKYCGGGMASFYPMLNSVVHVLMYTYYFMATWGPDMQKKLAKYKNKLTIIQMVQFVIMLLHMLTAMPSDCDVPKGLALFFFPNLLVIFYMFYDFYQKSYNKPEKKME